MKCKKLKNYSKTEQLRMNNDLLTNFQKNVTLNDLENDT